MRLAAEPEASRYLDPYLRTLRGGHYIQPYNVLTFVFLDGLADACRRVMSCLQLRLIGVDASDLPASPAAIGGDHYAVRIVVAIGGDLGNPPNRLTNAYLAKVKHRYAMEKARLPVSAVPVVRMQLPTLREAVDLTRACPHLRLAADVDPGRTR